MSLLGQFKHLKLILFRLLFRLKSIFSSILTTLDYIFPLKYEIYLYLDKAFKGEILIKKSKCMVLNLYNYNNSTLTVVTPYHEHRHNM